VSASHAILRLHLYSAPRLMAETSPVGAEKSRKKHGRCDRDASNVFTAARPRPPSRGNDTRRQILGRSSSGFTAIHIGSYADVQSLDDLSNLPPPSISQTPFYAHILSSLPSLRLSIKDAVTASTKTWLFDVRESGAKVGRLALEQMGGRIKKWRLRREKEGGVRLARVGGALEMVHNERVECELFAQG